MESLSLRTDDFDPGAASRNSRREDPEQKARRVEEVLNRYSATVYRLAAARTGNRADAEDVLQEVFLRYIRSAPDFIEEEHRKAWLLRVTLNCSKSLRSSAWFRHRAPLELLENTAVPEAPEPSPIYEAVLSLPAACRTVVHLHYYEGYPVAEMAKLLGCRENTVKSRLHRAREKLRVKLKDEEI